jgi:DNA-directed RNA polymerase
LLASDKPTSNEELQAFINGGQYWCGTCSPVHPPYVLFPLYSTQPANADWTTWQTTADQMIANRLSDIFISRQASSAELLNYLAAKGLKLIGEVPPIQEVLGNWVATVSWNIGDAIRKNWSEITANQDGKTFEASLMLTNVNPEWLSAGRLRLVQEVADVLQQGLLDPLDIPQ